jgi:hypothetical protein
MSHLIAAGGTGEEVAAAALRIGYLMDRPTPTVSVIDSDVAGNSGMGAGYSTRKQELDSLATRFLSLGIVGREFLRTVNPADLSTRSDGAARPVEVNTIRDIFRSPGQAGLAPEDDMVLDLLLTEKQRATKISDGFHGQPALGSLVVRAAMESKAWDGFLESFKREASQGGGIRAVVAGSVTGGVGTAVLPTLMDKLCEIGRTGQGISLHGVFLLPWFVLQKTAQDPTSREPDVDTATMERNASCLTRGYLERILTEQLQSALLLGLPAPVARTSQGGSLQRETRHYLNIVAGIFAQRMLDAKAWTSTGITSVAIGNDSRRHYEGGADGPSYGNFSLRRLAAIGRSMVAATAALEFEVSQSDPALTHQIDIAGILKAQTPSERDEFVKTVSGFHALHQEIWQWLVASLEAQVGSERADTLGAFVPDEGWRGLAKATHAKALRTAGVRSWWLPLGRRVLKRLGPFKVPNDARGSAAAWAVIQQARTRVIQLTGR